MEKNRALQDENKKLSRELGEAAGQTALMFEKIILVSPLLTFTSPHPNTDGTTATGEKVFNNMLFYLCFIIGRANK